MRKRKICMGVLFLAVLFCSRLQFILAEEVRQVSLEEVLSIGNLDDNILFQWAGVAVDSQNYIYVTDAMDYCLKKFDCQGNLQKKIGRKGQGPGEFLAPRLLDCSRAYIYVTDQYVPGFQVFNKDLKFQHRIPLRMFINDFKVISDSEIAVAAVTSDQTCRILVLNTKGEVIRKFHYSEKKSSLMMNWIDFDFDSRKNLYIAYNFQDKIVKFDPQGKKLWSHSLMKMKHVKKKKVGSFVVPCEIVYKDIAVDSTGKVYVLSGEFSKNPSRDVYVLDPEGKQKAVLTLPEGSHCIYIDGSDFLYSRAGDGITLKKYRIVDSERQAESMNK